MDIRAFIASIVDSLAWPAAVVILVYLFKKPIGKLLLDIDVPPLSVAR